MESGSRRHGRALRSANMRAALALAALLASACASVGNEENYRPPPQGGDFSADFYSCLLDQEFRRVTLGGRSRAMTILCMDAHGWRWNP